tara:strand:+ start:373 stop:531 length:159 start_codon:yes stop_codon:yes gene_type:complete
VENEDAGWVFQVFRENISYYQYISQESPIAEETLRDRIEAILTLDPVEEAKL